MLRRLPLVVACIVGLQVTFASSNDTIPVPRYTIKGMKEDLERILGKIAHNEAKGVVEKVSQQLGNLLTESKKSEQSRESKQDISKVRNDVSKWLREVLEQVFDIRSPGENAENEYLAVVEGEKVGEENIECLAVLPRKEKYNKYIDAVKKLLQGEKIGAQEKLDIIVFTIISAVAQYLNYSAVLLQEVKVGNKNIVVPVGFVVPAVNELQNNVVKVFKQFRWGTVLVDLKSGEDGIMRVGKALEVPSLPPWRKDDKKFATTPLMQITGALFRAFGKMAQIRNATAEKELAKAIGNKTKRKELINLLFSFTREASIPRKFAKLRVRTGSLKALWDRYDSLAKVLGKDGYKVGVRWNYQKDTDAVKKELREIIFGNGGIKHVLKSKDSDTPSFVSVTESFSEAPMWEISVMGHWSELEEEAKGALAVVRALDDALYEPSVYIGVKKVKKDEYRILLKMAKSVAKFEDEPIREGEIDRKEAWETIRSLISSLSENVKRYAKEKKDESTGKELQVWVKRLLGDVNFAEVADLKFKNESDMLK